ncbi:hypothetical protein HFO09_35560 [Rhizobium laguerreae]|uniref:hypothetical protein n=1 Tax=Rhizobium laguerreae TaxID=1076926 RepID=UPI001C90802D|nr:hypothetical protein [Rhizobium laguerreae]MBY3259924.1 hypothetical protein [Rhizobium laguerreae]MBY3287384.1 hypothetical protein [Rhizobium laguerreae]MBY3294273.1 hypothetical protein [Rhizobium laguerreae]
MTVTIKVRIITGTYLERFGPLTWEAGALNKMTRKDACWNLPLEMRRIQMADVYQVQSGP